MVATLKLTFHEKKTPMIKTFIVHKKVNAQGSASHRKVKVTSEL